MNAFGDALNLVFMRWSWWFSSGSMPMDSRLRLHSHEFLFLSQWIQDSDCIPMSSYSSANESQTAFPWVPVLFPSQWISGCLSSCPIPKPMNLWMHSHEFLFQANGVNLRLHSHEFLFPSQWISGCLSSCPIPKPMDSRLRLHSHEFLFPCQILESFGWVPSISCHPDSGMPLGFHQMRPERDFGCTPYNHTWVPIKSIVERFRRLLRDFRFWSNFSIFRVEKILIFDA